MRKAGISSPPRRLTVTDEDLARWHQYGAMVWEVYDRLRPAATQGQRMSEQQKYDSGPRSLRVADMVARLTLKAPSDGWGPYEHKPEI
jgi:hypothetical protein